MPTVGAQPVTWVLCPTVTYERIRNRFEFREFSFDVTCQ
jgi:hypothetical protein